MDCSFLPAARAHFDRGSSALLLGTPHFLVTERRQEGWKGLYMGHTRAKHTEASSPDSPLHPPIGSGNTQPTSKCSNQAQCRRVCKGKEKKGEVSTQLEFCLAETWATSNIQNQDSASSYRKTTKNKEAFFILEIKKHSRTNIFIKEQKDKQRSLRGP